MATDSLFLGNLTEIALENDDFRYVVYTGHKQQIVVMSVPPKGSIPREVHPENDQLFRVESGKGILSVGNDTHYAFSTGTTIVIPAGTYHKIQNSTDQPLKLSTIYTPPHHHYATYNKTN
jgi:mannose-6-phosphate isomerase-like protein (cupin superfamily)